MDIEKLIEDLRIACAGNQHNIMGVAATALSTLQAENSQLRDSRDHWKRLAHELSEGVNGKDAEHERLQAENEKLREKIEDARLEGYAKGLGEMSAELEQVKRENNALWTYIEIIDREYRRYMDRGYIDRLDELRRTWKYGQKED